MNIQTQTSADRAQLGELIKDMSVTMLTTADLHGALVSRPMCPLEMDSKGAIWFFTELHSPELQQQRAAHLSFVDTEHSTYVSVSGYSEILVDHDRIESLWTPFAKPWFPDGVDSANLALLKFIPNTVEYWDSPNSKVVRTFAMAASVIVGKPIGLGEHDRLTSLS